nr:hypothetical protein [Tanacetum cinerariifolium]
MLVAEGLDLYIHEKRRGLALVVHFGFADESSNRLLRHKIEGDVIAEFYGPSRWKELSKEMSSKILPCGDRSC